MNRKFSCDAQFIHLVQRNGAKKHRFVFYLSFKEKMGVLQSLLDLYFSGIITGMVFSLQDACEPIM
jgi:hypothetical protein